MAATVIGIHPIEPTEEQFRETVQSRYGDDLSGSERGEAESQIRDWFANLYLIEIEVNPPDAEFFDSHPPTQEAEGLPRRNWQVAYDERPLDQQGARWIFFLHFVNLKKSLITSAGSLALPKPTPMPKRIADLLAVDPYEAP